MEDFVMIEAEPGFKYEKHRASFFNQLENALSLQINKCDYYKKYFEEQNNPTLANKFAAYSMSGVKNLELLKLSWKNNEVLPKYKYEILNFSCLPVNVDVQDRELQLVVKTSNLPVTDNAQIYVMAEFFFPSSKNETITESFARWIRNIKIEPKSACSDEKHRQLDMIYANPNFVPFNDPESKMMEFDRPLSFFIERGKSRTLKRKFKPIKLTFYEKTNFFRLDKKIGVVQVKIDDINDEISLVTRLPLMNGRKQTEASADIRVKIREPLVNKSIRAHEERILFLT